MAAVTNISAAADIPDVYTITIGGTWAANDTLTITCGDTRGVTIDLGAAGSTTTSNIAAEVAAILVARTKRDGVGTGYTWTEGALHYPEFNEIADVSISGSVVTVEGAPGKPITLTASETSTSGTVTVANPQAATGKYFFNNADNWDTGSVPGDGADIYFNEGSQGVRYGFPASIDPASITAFQEFEGWIGLPIINRDDPNFPYYEYRTRYLALDNDAANDGALYIGEGTGRGSPLINIDWASTTRVDVTVANTGTPVPALAPYALNLKGASTTFFPIIYGGSVSFNFEEPDTSNMDDLVVSGGDVYIGAGTTFAGSPVIHQSGGRVWASYGGTITTWNLTGGSVFEENRGSGVITTLNVLEGTTFDSSCDNTITTVICSGSLLFGRLAGAKTLTNVTLTKGGRLYDPHRKLTLTNDIILRGCGLAPPDVSLDFGREHKVAILSV